MTGQNKSIISIIIRAIDYLLTDKRGEAYLKLIDDILWYIRGKTKIKIKEYFPKTGKTFSELIENTIRYEAGHSAKSTNYGGKVS